MIRVCYVSKEMFSSMSIQNLGKHLAGKGSHSSLAVWWAGSEVMTPWNID